jgi:hypothetical protein
MNDEFFSGTRRNDRGVDVIDVTSSVGQLGFPFRTFVERSILRDLAEFLGGDEDGDLALEFLAEWILDSLSGKKSAEIVSHGRSMTVRFPIRVQRRGGEETGTLKLAIWFGPWEQATVVITAER